MIEQAINETLLLLTRQYRDIKEELETAKRIFIKENTQTVIIVKHNFLFTTHLRKKVDIIFHFILRYFSTRSLRNLKVTGLKMMKSVLYLSLNQGRILNLN